MRVLSVRDRTVAISRYPDPAVGPGELDTTIVAIETDVRKGGKPVVGFGFTSVGRFGQSGLIRERFAPRLTAATPEQLTNGAGDNFDPFRAWDCIMRGEKAGGHGERSVAVGALDMAVWDAAAKIADQPLFRFIASLTGTPEPAASLPVYAAGGYPYPTHDIANLTDEIQRYLDDGYTNIKMKIGTLLLAEDLKRIEAALTLLPGGEHLAVDAMNRYSANEAMYAAQALAPYQLRWFEDMCDPLDFETHAQIADGYPFPLAVGEALFSAADCLNLLRYARLRPAKDVLLFDPAHCYGIPGYRSILEVLDANGWPRRACQPHGGHLFSLHVAAGFGLGGSEANPLNFQPFGGFSDDAAVEDGRIRLPEAPGIGFETRASLRSLFESLLG